MIESVGWNWKEADQKRWLNPSEDSYYYAKNWKACGCKSVLDLGSGLGRHSILFAKEGFKVTACDISQDGLDYLKKWQKEEGVNILCKQADMKNLPFSDNGFDCLFAFHSISHTDTEGFKQVLSEIERVLRPNGKLFCTLCSKETWHFTEPSYPHIDDNTVLKTDGAEINVPHFYVNLDDILELFSDFTITRIRHIHECYTDGMKTNHKHYYIEATLNKTSTEPDYSQIIGKEVSGHIDRPLGTKHPRHPNIVYPINYGYVDGIFAPDNSEQDIYLLGVNEPVDTFKGRVIAVYHRHNDIEDKWIVVPDSVPEGSVPYDEEILKAIDFQEKFFDGKLYR